MALKRSQLLMLEILGVIIGLLFLIPFYFVVFNSLKTFGDILANSASLPSQFYWQNYTKVWEIMKFPQAFTNSLFITVLSNVGLVLVSSMSAYMIARRNNKWNKLLFLLYVAAMVIPFQSIMIPLVRVSSHLNLMNSHWGLVVAYLGFGVSLNVFLYHGFIKSIPREIEESAIVDGCSTYGVFFKMIWPLLKPITITVILLNSLWIWNDFLLPSLFLYDVNLRTIPLSTYSFFGQYTKQWDLALAGLVLGIIPIIIFFLALQKHIIAGITAGSVKG